MTATVRPASSGDAAAIGAVQSRSWRLAYADLLPPQMLAEMTPQVLAEPWRRAVAEPPSPRHVVLVAVADDLVIGFLALAGIEIAALVVDPFHQRQGHGSRLLAAAVDTLRDGDASRLQIWVPEADEVMLSFLASAGITPDGARRTYLRQDGGEVIEVRAAADLGDA